jgi:multidrug efflux pump subunit AcrB
MWIVQLALRRPYTFIVVALLLLIIGPLAIVRTPTDIFPNINIPVVSVVWAFNGLSAEEMEGRIVGTFERALTTTVNDIEHIESQSLEGVAVVKIFFHQGAQVQTALSQVTAISQTLLRVLPPGITPPLILSYNASTVPVLQLALSSKTLQEQQLFDLGNNFIRTQLATVQGAGIPFPYGGKQRQVQVDIDAAALQSKGLAPLDVVNAVTAQNLILPAGTAKIGTREYDVDMNYSPKTVAEMNDFPIRTLQGNTVYMRDVAHVRDGFAPQTNIVRHDGVRAALMTIQKTGNASTLDIVDRVRALLPSVAAGLPPSLNIDPVADQSLFVRAAVQGVIREGLIAACLTALMILVFLGSWRSTLIIAVSIPLSILTSIAVLSALGETINIMTLGGLALAVGILVDDATVAIENISQNREQGKELEHAILDGAQQIAVPTLVSTLSICIVFIPMFLLTGVARYLFVPLAEAVVFAMLASYFFSRTLIPTLAMYLLRREGHSGGDDAGPRGWFGRLHARFERGFHRLQETYHRGLASCMARPRVFGGLFLGACVLSLGLIPFLGRDFFPSVDAGQIKLHMRAATATRIEESARLCDLVEQSIRESIPPGELSSILDNIGLPVSGINLSYGNSGTIGNADADILVSLKEGHRPTEQYVHDLRQKLVAQFPGISFSFLPADIVSQILNFGLPAPIDVQIVGQDLQGNRQHALKLIDKLNRVDGIVDLRIQQPFDQPKLHIQVDRTKAQDAGFSLREVANNLLIALSGSSQTSPNFWLNPSNRVAYQIAVQTPQYEMDSLDALGNIPVTGAGGAKPAILSSLSTIDRGSGQALISHYNVQPVIDIYGGVQGRDLGGVADEITRIVDDSRKDLPRGSRIVVRGQVQTMSSSFSGLLIGLVFAIVLVYLLMVVNFQSWLDPFIIITALPGALAGIVWMLFLTHTTVSVPALTGAIMCIGIATANSILVVSFARDQLRLGHDALAAALQAGVTRLRPVMMTALAMMIGMVPMALGLGEGGEQNAPLGRAVIGGLLLATVATLFFVPTVFAVIHSRRPRDATVSQGPALLPGPPSLEH